MEIDKKSVLPLYYQLKEILKEEIDIGKYKSGDRIPSENELCKKLNISRNTAKQAIASLVTEGILYREQGKGTFVAEKKIFDGLSELFSFSARFSELNGNLKTKIIFTEEIKESKEALKYLNLKKNIDLFRIQRLRLLEDQPISLQTSYIPKQFCKKLLKYDLEKESLINILKEKFGAKFSHFTETISCISADQYEADLLKVKKGSSLFLITRKTLSKNNEIIEFARSFLPGDRCEFYIGPDKEVSIGINNKHR
jgi:GntR family transcriptional regulator, N-acetylglucosamine utilization regulator